MWWSNQTSKHSSFEEFRNKIIAYDNEVRGWRSARDPSTSAPDSRKKTTSPRRTPNVEFGARRIAGSDPNAKYIPPHRYIAPKEHSAYKGGYCYVCGEEGHTSRECPRRATSKRDAKINAMEPAEEELITSGDEQPQPEQEEETFYSEN